MIKEEFNKLQIGDLVEWNNTVTTDANKLGIVVGATEFKTTMCRNGTTQDSSYYQIRIKWNDYEYTSAYTENDDSSNELIELISKAKK